jgi:hypothetical protein
MIESPLIQELMAERTHKDILRFLAGRFGLVPPEIAAALQSIEDEQAMDDLVALAVRCPDLEAFAIGSPSKQGLWRKPSHD